MTHNHVRLSVWTKPHERPVDPSPIARLSLIQDGNKVRVVRRDTDGTVLSHLITFYPNGRIHRHHFTKDQLKLFGFVGDSHGRITEYREDEPRCCEHCKQ